MSSLEVLTVGLPLEPHSQLRIFQGFDGPYSHQDHLKTPNGCIRQMKHAVDFATPFGAQVRAALEGRVVFIKKDAACYRGLDPSVGIDLSGTWLAIRHGSVFSIYGHLDPSHIQVSRGQWVERGEILAHTGETGWVGPVPHLHFHMMGNGASRPFQFDGSDFPFLEDAKLFNGVSHEERIQGLLACL